LLARRPFLMIALLLGCAHGQNGRAELEEANDAFAKEIRWSDMTGLRQQVMPERQLEFSQVTARGEDNLKVTDYELVDVQVSTDKAIVHSRVSWYREPSITTKTESMTVLWERKGNAWLIAAISGGPLPLRPAPPSR
jgi:hypothetical protein